MRRISIVVVLVFSAALGMGSIASAQTAAGPTIYNVTLRDDGGTAVLTISGTGFGREPVVTVDGQTVTVLQGGAETQIDVLAPAALLTIPGTYRLTVIDPALKAGDAFVVASQGGKVLAAGVSAPQSESPVVVTESATAPAARPASVPTTTMPQTADGLTLQTAIEDSGFPYRTAIGFHALFSNTTGTANTASGWTALQGNTTGTGNTANGTSTLVLNTTGSYNTASGYEALYASNGDYNTASGYQALRSNTTGSNNAASGYQALRSNTTGGANTASGVDALGINTTGLANTATGYLSLFANSSGSFNTALGYSAGYNATGSYNLFLGAYVSGSSDDSNTIRIGQPNGAGTGQNRTFIAGIYDTVMMTGVRQVVIKADGQLGTMLAVSNRSASVNIPMSGTPQQAPDQQQQLLDQQRQLQAQQQLVRDQQTTIADLSARLARLEALLAPAAGDDRTAAGTLRAPDTQSAP